MDQEVVRTRAWKHVHSGNVRGAQVQPELLRGTVKAKVLQVGKEDVLAPDIVVKGLPGSVWIVPGTTGLVGSPEESTPD